MKTKLLHYADLSWPEVAELDRNTPLVIPIGEGCPEEKLLDIFLGEDTLAVLPPIPYGWKESIIFSNAKVFQHLLLELSKSVTDSGFFRVIFALPEDLHIEGLPDSLHISGWIEKAKTDRIMVDPEKVVVIPIGHVEQHALHLPLSTDSDCIAAIATGIQEKNFNDALCLPVFPYGVSMHQKSFAGTITISGRTFEEFWIDIVNELFTRGFRKLYLINGHGGNHSFLVNVIKYAGDEHPEIFCATSWLYLSGPKGIQALEQQRGSKLGGMGHACELETSLMLAIKPNLVHMERVVDEIDFISTPSYYQDWIEGGTLIANPPWEDDTATGAYGAGSYATTAKGQFWLTAAIEEKIDHIREIKEQYDRRMRKRLQNSHR